jgi:hypothetical protein
MEEQQPQPLDPCEDTCPECGTCLLGEPGSECECGLVRVVWGLTTMRQQPKRAER